MERLFLLLVSVCKELNWKSSGQIIFIDLSFNMETVLMRGLIMFDKS